MGKLKVWLAAVWYSCTAWLASWKSAGSDDLAALARDYVAASNEVFWRVVKSRPMVWLVIASMAAVLSLGGYWVGHRLASRHTAVARAEIVDLRAQLAASNEEKQVLSQQLAAAESNIKEAAKPTVSVKESAPQKVRKPYRRPQSRQAAPSQGLF